MSIDYEFVKKVSSTKRLYKLSQPVSWMEYLPLKDIEEKRETEFFVVSLGKLGDTAIFPADEDGSISDFMLLFFCNYWVTDFDEFIRYWLDAEEEAENVRRENAPNS